MAFGLGKKGNGVEPVGAATTLREQVLQMGDGYGALVVERGKVEDAQKRRAELWEKLAVVEAQLDDPPNENMDADVAWYQDMMARKAGIQRAIEATDLRIYAGEEEVRRVERVIAAEVARKIEVEAGALELSIRERLLDAIMPLEGEIEVLRALLEQRAKALFVVDGEPDDRFEASHYLRAGDSLRDALHSMAVSTGLVEVVQEPVMVNGPDGRQVPSTSVRGRVYLRRKAAQ